MELTIEVGCLLKAAYRFCGDKVNKIRMAYIIDARNDFLISGLCRIKEVDLFIRALMFSCCIEKSDDAVEDARAVHPYDLFVIIPLIPYYVDFSCVGLSSYLYTHFDCRFSLSIGELSNNLVGKRGGCLFYSWCLGKDSCFI